MAYGPASRAGPEPVERNRDEHREAARARVLVALLGLQELALVAHDDEVLDKRDRWILSLATKAADWSPVWLNGNAETEPTGDFPPWVQLTCVQPPSDEATDEKAACALAKTPIDSVRIGKFFSDPKLNVVAVPALGFAAGVVSQPGIEGVDAATTTQPAGGRACEKFGPGVGGGPGWGH